MYYHHHDQSIISTMLESANEKCILVSNYITIGPKFEREGERDLVVFYLNFDMVKGLVTWTEDGYVSLLVIWIQPISSLLPGR